jgi:hypothetical protein
MMIPWTVTIGAFVRWLIKGCKTSLRDEIEGCFPAKWGGSYEIENYIIGIITVVITLAVILYVFYR